MLHVVWHSYQDGALHDTRHEAESFAEMLIGCWIAINPRRVLVVRHFGGKIIKRKYLDQPSVSGYTILVRRGYGQSGLGVTWPWRRKDQPAPEPITRLGRSPDTCRVLTQPNARRDGNAIRGKELDGAGISCGPNVLGGNPNGEMGHVARPYAVQNLPEEITVLRGTRN